MFKFGMPRSGELSTWIGAGGLTAALALFVTAEQADAISVTLLAVLGLLSAFNKEEDADRKTSML